MLCTEPLPKLCSPSTTARFKSCRQPATISDGSALRLTTAKYYTPSHKVIHEKGITPDVVVPMSAEEERFLAIKRSGAPLDALDEKDREQVTKARVPQLDRATDMLKGILLYDKQGKPVGKVAAQKP